MILASVVSGYYGTGTDDDPYRPSVSDLYNLKMRDVTGAPEVDSTIPVLCVQIWCSDAVMASIETDPNHNVVWSEAV